MAGLVVPLLEACSNPSPPVTGCVVTPTEEEGPFPYTPDGTTRSEISNPLNRTDVRSNYSDGVMQTGIPLTLNFLVVNTNGACSPVLGARVDIWHCNRNGWYSGYGGQSGGVSGTPSSYVGQTWLRGYQTTSASAVAQFITVYPGWYSGRATHVHMEVFMNGVLVKIGQVAFPETISDAVHVTTDYTAHGINTTRNATDSVFGNSGTDLANETLAMTGDVTNGFTGTYAIGIPL